MPFRWKYSENYEDGSIGYTMNLNDGRLIGAILVGDNSEDFSDYRVMLGINIANDTMMAFERNISSSTETSVAQYMDKQIDFTSRVVGSFFVSYGE